MDGNYDVFFPYALERLATDNRFWDPALLMGFSGVFGGLSQQYEVPQAKEDYALRIDGLRYRGLYPAEGRGTDDDVRRLKESGQKRLALRLYWEIHQGSLAHGTDNDVRFLKELGAKRWATRMYSEVHNSTLWEARRKVSEL